MKKKNLTKFEIVCYVVAALLMIVALYMLKANIDYMNEYLAAYGMTMADLGSQATQTLVGAFVPYAAYAFFAVAAGKIYHAVAAPKCECTCEEEAEEEVLELEAPVEALEAPKCECECECTCEETLAEEQSEGKAEEVVAVVWAQTPEAVVAEDEAK